MINIRLDRRTTKACIGVVAFVAYVFGFAFMYYIFLPNGFQHSTIENEAAYSKLVTTVEQTLADALLDEYRAIESLSHILGRAEGWSPRANVTGTGSREYLVTPNINAVQILSVVKLRVSLLRGMTLKNDPNIDADTFVGVFVPYRRAIVGDCEAFVTSPGFPGASSVGSRSSGWYIQCDFEAHESIDAKLREKEGQWQWAYYLELSDQQAAEFQGLENPSKGMANGLFTRMLYFSAVTATTLGYGDIVPITNAARLAVAVESMLGLILMGSIVFWVTKS